MTATAPGKAVRDPATGRYAHSGDLSRVCVCGHDLGDHVHGGFECLGAGAPCDCEKFRPTHEKAAPIPADVVALAAEATHAIADAMPIGTHRQYIIARAIMQDRADRASQEERIREDEPGYLVRIAFREGRSGGLRISSPDVPGLILSHHDEPAILADMVEVLRETERARLPGDAS